MTFMISWIFRHFKKKGKRIHDHIQYCLHKIKSTRKPIHLALQNCAFTNVKQINIPPLQGLTQNPFPNRLVIILFKLFVSRVYDAQNSRDSTRTTKAILNHFYLFWINWMKYEFPLHTLSNIEKTPGSLMCTSFKVINKIQFKC